MNKGKASSKSVLYSYTDGKIVIGKRAYNATFLQIASYVLMFLGLMSVCITAISIMRHGYRNTDVFFIVLSIIVFLYGYLYNWMCKDVRRKSGKPNILDRILYSRGEWEKEHILGENYNGKENND